MRITISTFIGTNQKEEACNGTNDETSDSNCTGVTDHERSISTIELQPQQQQPISSTKQEVCIQIFVFYHDVS